MFFVEETGDVLLCLFDAGLHQRTDSFLDQAQGKAGTFVQKAREADLTKSGKDHGDRAAQGSVGPPVDETFPEPTQVGEE